eukprot:1314660-Pleurochrysis_carterae.AAC.1
MVTFGQTLPRYVGQAGTLESAATCAHGRESEGRRGRWDAATDSKRAREEKDGTRRRASERKM